MTTIINITKEVIESQHLINGFSVCVDNKGSIIISPLEKKNPREGWAEIIEKDIEMNGNSALEFKDNLEEIKDWTW